MLFPSPPFLTKIVSPGDLPAAPAAPALRLQLRTCIVEHKRTRLLAMVNGADTKNLDRALPRRHTKQLYDGLSRENAGTLSQLRTGKAQINSYLKLARV